MVFTPVLTYAYASCNLAVTSHLHRHDGTDQGCQISTTSAQTWRGKRQVAWSRTLPSCQHRLLLCGNLCLTCLHSMSGSQGQVCLWKSINACHSQFEASSLYGRASEGNALQNLSYMLRHLVMACQRSVNDSVHHLHVLQGLPHVKCHISFCRTIVANCKCLAALWWQPTGLTDFKGCLHNA